MTRPDFDELARLTLNGFTTAGQLNLDPFLQSTFITLVAAVTERAYRLGRNGGGMSEEERASAFRAGLERAAEVVEHAASMPSHGIPAEFVIRAAAAALRGQAEKWR